MGGVFPAATSVCKYISFLYIYFVVELEFTKSMEMPSSAPASGVK